MNIAWVALSCTAQESTNRYDNDAAGQHIIETSTYISPGNLESVLNEIHAAAQGCRVYFIGPVISR